MNRSTCNLLCTPVHRPCSTMPKAQLLTLCCFYPLTWQVCSDFSLWASKYCMNRAFMAYVQFYPHLWVLYCEFSSVRIPRRSILSPLSDELSLTESLLEGHTLPLAGFAKRPDKVSSGEPSACVLCLPECRAWPYPCITAWTWADCFIVSASKLLQQSKVR